MMIPDSGLLFWATLYSHMSYVWSRCCIACASLGCNCHTA